MHFQKVQYKSGYIPTQYTVVHDYAKITISFRINARLRHEISSNSVYRWDNLRFGGFLAFPILEYTGCFDNYYFYHNFVHRYLEQLHFSKQLYFINFGFWTDNIFRLHIGNKKLLPKLVGSWDFPVTIIFIAVVALKRSFRMM